MEIVAALARDADTPFELRSVDLAPPRDDEVLVRLAGVGICHTDLVMKSGVAPFPFPAVLGHEGAGVVRAVGADVAEIGVGDHVVMSFNSCGHCRQCAASQPAYCSDMIALNYSGARPDGSATLHDGETALGCCFFGQSSFATHALAPARSLVRVDQSLPLDILGPLGCGIQTGAGAVLRSLDLDAQATLLVSGAGAVGLSAVMAAKLRGCREVIVVEPNAARRQLALELGATLALDVAAPESLLSAVMARVPGGVDAAIDTSGNGKSLETCLAALATRGVLGLVGAAASDTPLPGHVNGVLSRGVTIRGIIEGDSDPRTFIPELLEHYRAGRFPFDRLIRRYPFRAINEAVAEHLSGACVKPVLVMAGEPVDQLP